MSDLTEAISNLRRLMRTDTTLMRINVHLDIVLKVAEERTAQCPQCANIYETRTVAQCEALRGGHGGTPSPRWAGR